MTVEKQNLIQPVLRDAEFMADVERAKNESPKGDDFSLWWLGQSGFLLQWRNRHLLFDPYLSDSLTKKYQATDKPHVRMTARVVAPENLSFIDVATSSHNHTDHLDHETLIPLFAANPNMKFVVPEANREFVGERLRRDAGFAIGLDDSETVAVDDFKITAVAAAHENLERNERGQHKFLSYLVNFGENLIYHSSDCVPYNGLAQRVVELANNQIIDVALLPINGRKPERRVTGNFWGDEAARLAKAVNARVCVPMHYEMFEFNTETTGLFVAECEKIKQNYRILRGGERFSSGEVV